MSEDLLGWPLEAALEELARRGFSTVQVSRTLAPRRDGLQGGWRVLRVREEGAALDVGAFPPGVPLTVLPEEACTQKRPSKG